MSARYEMTDGYVSMGGESWKPVDNEAAAVAIESAMQFLGYPETHREQFVSMLNTL